MDDQTSVLDAAAGELSGPHWVQRFPGSALTSELAPAFREGVERFIAAMRAAGMRVTVTSTYRPPQRSYLMHWCWKIKRGTDARSVPPMAGVDINWVHPTAAQSLQAAKRMVTAYGMDGLNTAPALRSLHSERQAIDMNIAWTGAVSITDANGVVVRINTTPRTGMNVRLRTVGATYKVHKFVGGESDKPHWSSTGHLMPSD